MEETQFIRNALITAYQRAYHAVHDAPKIFDDFLAFDFLTEEERASFEKFFLTSLQSYDPVLYASFPDQAAIMAWMMQTSPGLPITLSRARYAEDILEMAVRQGVQQYIILGAGMDTFAFRRADMLAQIQVFELDHPATQAFKRRRLSELGWEQPKNLHFVPVDFTKDSLAATLKCSSYTQKTPSFFSWLGVTYYLPREVVFETLRPIADITPAGSTVIFDYLDTDAFVPGRAAKRVLGMLEVARHLGTPMKLGFDPSTLAADLASLGFNLKENLSPSDIQERYFQGRTDDYHALEHAYIVWAVVE